MEGQVIIDGYPTAPKVGDPVRVTGGGQDIRGTIATVEPNGPGSWVLTVVDAEDHAKPAGR